MIQYMFVVLAAALRDRKGVSSLEYAVLAVGIVGAVSVAAANLGSNLSTAFSHIVTEINPG